MGKQYNAQATANALGVAEADFTPPARFFWNVTQITVSSSSALASTTKVFVDQKYFCGSAVGNGDSADGSALRVNNNQTLRIVWSGCTPAAVCVCNIQVEENEVGT